MKIWLEALTGKQALLVHHLALKFEELGHETLITSRPYSIDRANSNLDRLGRKHYSIGVYGGARLLDKLVEGAKRIIELAPLIAKEKPDLLVSFPSPDAFRTAFGLGIKSIQINDTPHSYAPGKLTISLANALVYSEAIQERDFARLGVTAFYPYRGVDEVLWTKDPQIYDKVLDKLDLEKRNYIVVRCEESKAGYFQEFFPEIEPGSTILVKIVEELRKNGLQHKIVAFPRYPEQEAVLENTDVIIPDKSIDTLSLLAHASASLTGGGTMARESALLGTPSIYTFPKELAVSTYIAKKGFPISQCTRLPDVTKLLIKQINSPPMDEEKKQLLIGSMETPFEGVLRVLKDLDLK